MRNCIEWWEMILKLCFYGISPLGLRNTQMGLGAKMGTVFWFVFSDALFWLQNRFSGWSTLCLLADQTICFSSIRFVTYGPCFLLICLCGNSVGTTKESQRHPGMPYFMFSPWSSSWNPLESSGKAQAWVGWL